MDLNIDKLREKVKDRIAKPMDVKGHYSVLIPLIYNNDRWEIIYELRSKYMKTQPGEVSFPGGRLENGENYKQAAIRETVEELGIVEEDIEILGELDFLVSYADFTIHCFLGIIDGVSIKEMDVNPDEVDHIFTVPVEFFLGKEPLVSELALRTEESESFPYELIPEGKNYNFREGRHRVLFYQYEGYIIWGLTASMTKQFVEIIKDI
jgi:coenzyme A diphosphatase NUDT7